MGKKGVDLGLPHFRWMSFVMKENETLDPEAVGLFGPAAVVPRTKRKPDLIQEFELWRGGSQRMLTTIGRYT